MASKNVAEIILRAKDDATKQINAMGGGLGSLAKAAGVAAGAFLAFQGARAAVASLQRNLADATRAATENATATLRLHSALRAAGETSESAKTEIEEAATALQRQGVMAGAAATQLAAYVLNLGASAAQTPRMVTAATDLASALGVGVETAAQQLARTLSGDLSPRLAVLLPELRDLTKEQLEAGDAIEVVERRFSGMAAATLTNADRLKNLSGTWGDFRGSLVQATIESSVIGAQIQDLNGWLIDLSETVAGMDLGPMLADMTVGLVSATHTLVEFVGSLGGARSNLAWIGGPGGYATNRVMRSMFKGVFEGADSAASALAVLRDRMQESADNARRSEEEFAETQRKVNQLREETGRLFDRSNSLLDRQITLTERLGDASGEAYRAIQNELMGVSVALRRTEDDSREAEAEYISSMNRLAELEEERRKQTRAYREELKAQQEAERKAAEAAKIRAQERAAQERRIAEMTASNNESFVSQAQRINAQLIQDAEARARRLFEIDAERIRNTIAGETEKNAMIEAMELQLQQRIREIRDRREQEEEERRQRDAHAHKREMDKIQADMERAAEASRRRGEIEAEAERQKTQEMISLGQQAGAILVSQQEGRTSSIIALIAREAAAYAFKWVAQTVPPPASFILAPAAGAAMGALLMRLQNATFHTGGIIGPEDGIRRPGQNRIVQVQTDEAVLNRSAVQRMGRGAVEAMNTGTGGGAGRGITINLASLDASTIEMEMREGGRLNRALRRAFSRGDIS